MHGRRLVIAACTISAASACRSSPKRIEPVRLMAVQLESRLYTDDGVGITDSTRQVIRDTTAYRQAWSLATRAQRNEPARAEIDFTRDMVIVASAGRMRPGDRIRVDSIGVLKQSLTVIVRTTAGCTAMPGAAYPVEIVRVPAVSGTVSFEERRERAQGC
jgi:hypothetical protein